MSSLLGHQGQSKAPSPPNASEEPSFEHTAHQGSSHFHSPLPVKASGLLQRRLPFSKAQRRIVLLEAELRGSKQDLAQLERDITRLTKELRSQRNQIIVLERGEDDFRGTITQLETENEKLRQQRPGSARMKDLEAQVGASTANRKIFEEGIMMNVSVDMDTIIEVAHGLKARICDAVKGQFAAGAGQSVGNVEGDAQGHLEQNVETIDKSGHTETIPGPGSVAQDEQAILPSLGTQLAEGTYSKPSELVSKARPQHKDTLDHVFGETLDDEIHRFLNSCPSSDRVGSRVGPKEILEAAYKAAIENMSDAEPFITTTLVPRAIKSLAEKPQGSEKTESLKSGSSTSEDHVVRGLISRKPVGLLRKSAKPGSPTSPTLREPVTGGKWNLSINPEGSNKYGGVRVYSDEQDSLPWNKRRKTDR